MSFFAHLPGGIRKVLVFYQTLLKMDACNHCASVYMYFMATCKARQTLLTQSCKLQKISQMNMKRKTNPKGDAGCLSWMRKSQYWCRHLLIAAVKDRRTDLCLGDPTLWFTGLRTHRSPLAGQWRGAGAKTTTDLWVWQTWPQKTVNNYFKY